MEREAELDDLPLEILSMILCEAARFGVVTQLVLQLICKRWLALRPFGRSVRKRNEPRVLLLDEAAGAFNNRLLLDWLRGTMRCKPLRLPATTCAAAAWRGHLDSLKWLRENGCPWDWQSCAMAAKGGHLDILKWLREQGCPWNETTCSSAAEGDCLEVLQWARENGCEWDWRTIFQAVENQHEDVLQWALLHGCPSSLKHIDDTVFKDIQEAHGRAANLDDFEILEILGRGMCTYILNVINH